jgi:hypothetical protein
MLIELLVKRVGPSPVLLDKTRYLFMPISVNPDGSVIKKGEPTTSVCEIDKPEHLEFIRRYPNTYREYVQGQPLEAKPITAIPKSMMGYSITKFTEGGKEGYIVENKGKKLYAGLDGAWKDKKGGIFPFLSEHEAWQWLKDELEAQVDEPEEMKEKGFLCGYPGCGKACGSVAGLKAHEKTHIKTE